MNFRDWKHSLQKTGRPCVGLNGTVVSLPHAEQVVKVSTRSRGRVAPAGRLARLLLQALHRFGSFFENLYRTKPPPLWWATEGNEGNKVLRSLRFLLCKLSASRQEARRSAVIFATTSA